MYSISYNNRHSHIRQSLTVSKLCGTRRPGCSSELTLLVKERGFTIHCVQFIPTLLTRTRMHTIKCMIGSKLLQVCIRNSLQKWGLVQKRELIDQNIFQGGKVSICFLLISNC